MESLYVALGQRIKALRRERGVTQEELARRVGKTRTTIVNIEAGQLRLPVHLMIAIGNALGVATPELLGELTPQRTKNDTDFLAGISGPSRAAVLNAIRNDVGP